MQTEQPISPSMQPTQNVTAFRADRQTATLTSESFTRYISCLEQQLKKLGKVVVLYRWIYWQVDSSLYPVPGWPSPIYQRGRFLHKCSARVADVYAVFQSGGCVPEASLYAADWPHRVKLAQSKLLTHTPYSCCYHHDHGHYVCLAETLLVQDYHR